MNYQQRQDLEDCTVNWGVILASVLMIAVVLLSLYLAYEQKILTYILVGLSAVVAPVPVCYYVKQWKRKIDSQ